MIMLNMVILKAANPAGIASISKTSLLKQFKVKKNTIMPCTNPYPHQNMKLGNVNIVCYQPMK